jgi:hypothetical protein
MEERETSRISILGFKIPSPIERVVQKAGQSAHYWELDPMTSEALAKFAVINYRIRTIKEDFVGKTTPGINYRIDSWSKEEFDYGVPITRDNYASWIRNLSATAFNIYDKYLSTDNRTAEATREVQRAVDDLFPKIPSAAFPAKNP